jgi:hydroxymethylpyrimidine pyrophosphatase-like HAD family hydrolase
MRLAIFSDLDDTLFQTEAKCPSTQRSVAALDRQGQALSFHAPAQQALLHLLHPAATQFIPVTGRNSAALARVISPQFTGAAITSHGAQVLTPAREPDALWAAQIAPALTVWSSHLAAFTLAAQQLAAQISGGRARLIDDADVPVYVSCKGEPGYLDAVDAALSADWRALGGRLHRNGHNLALLPPYADKAAAVEFLMQRMMQEGDWLFLGLGDSVTDLPFLRLCDFALTPRTSQIHQKTWMQGDA